jgi:hypothetical protein
MPDMSKDARVSTPCMTFSATGELADFKIANSKPSK